MKNITVSLEDDLYRQARIAAAQADTSVTALVREFFTILTNSSPDKKNDHAILDAIDELRKKHPGFDASTRFSREEAHSRSL